MFTLASASVRRTLAFRWVRVQPFTNKKERSFDLSFLFGAGNRTRTCTLSQWNLNPPSLPIPPCPHILHREGAHLPYMRTIKQMPLPRRQFQLRCLLPDDRARTILPQSQHRRSSLPDVPEPWPDRCPRWYTGERSSCRITKKSYCS